MPSTGCVIVVVVVVVVSLLSRSSAVLFRRDTDLAYYTYKRESVSTIIYIDIPRHDRCRHVPEPRRLLRVYSVSQNRPVSS